MYLEAIKKQFLYYQSLGAKTFDQIPSDKIHWQYNTESNSIAIIVKHMVGNMLSRWTNFQTEDGEKEWRNRDNEFEDTYTSKEEMMNEWKKGWQCLFDAIATLKEDNLNDLIYIRNQGHTVSEAINRQLAHYSYHIGQIVFIGRMIQNEQWKSLSIPKNASKMYNKEKFDKKRNTDHYTDEFLDKE